MKNMTFDTSAEMTDIYDLLLRLGVTANYIGFFHTAFAVHLAIQEPERLREQVEVLAETCVAAAERGYLEGCIGLEEVRTVARIQLEEMLRRLYDGRLTETEGLREMIDEILEPGEHV